MTQLTERPFLQCFDIIAKKTRLTLDIEKEKYPDETVTFYLNGSSGKIGNSLEDVINKGVTFIEKDYDKCKYDDKKYLSAEYDDEQELVFVYMLYSEPLSRFRGGAKFGYHEFTRFALGKDGAVYLKKDGFESKNRCKYSGCDEKRHERNLKNDNLYYYDSGKDALPLNASGYMQIFKGGYINIENGTSSGFAGVLSNIMPVVYNTTGNKYQIISNYLNLLDYFSVAENYSCQKKSGPKQKYIDKMVEIPLPEVDKPVLEGPHSVYKFAVLQRVNEADEPTCCIRTFSYFVKEDLLFEGGRIYVTKKTAEFCKKNNRGEYVAQPLLQKVEHWDFEIMKFKEEETKGTMLEYFGSIISNISPENRSIAIWMFIKEPLFESLAKTFPIDFVDELIETLKVAGDFSGIYKNVLGLSKHSNKLLQAIGISKQQLEKIKDIMISGMPRSVVSGEKETLSLGMLPFIKGMLTGSESADISSIDIDTFEKYLDFAIDVFSLYSIWLYKASSVSEGVNTVLELRNGIIQMFPNFDISHDFKVFTQLIDKAGKRGYKRNDYWSRDNVPEFKCFEDYLKMLRRINGNPQNYQPRFSDLEDIRTMHDNIQILVEINSNKWMKDEFARRNNILWKNWEFEQKEEKKKDGTVKEKALPFVVVAPKAPEDLAREGTQLHHCVKSYIDRVANGETNIMFIRKVEEPDVPFFTVEVSNDNQIEQVHGFANRNASTEIGMTEFVGIWAKKKKLKTHTINKVR